MKRKMSDMKKRKSSSSAKDVTLEVYEHIVLPKTLPEGSTTLYATNLICLPGKKILKPDFDKFFKNDGKVVNVEIHYNPERDWEVDFAKIEFESHDAAKKALKDSDGRLFIHTIAILDVSLTPERNTNHSYKDKIIYVCGFGANTINSFKLQDNLRKHFSSCGVMFGIRTPDNMKTELSKGYAYIQFKDLESILKALEKDGSQFMGCTLQVRKAKVDITISDLNSGFLHAKPVRLGVNK